MVDLLLMTIFNPSERLIVILNVPGNDIAWFMVNRFGKESPVALLVIAVLEGLIAMGFVFREDFHHFNHVAQLIIGIAFNRDQFTPCIVIIGFVQFLVGKVGVPGLFYQAVIGRF